MGDHANWKRLGSGELLTEDADVGLGHVLPVSDYNKVFILLLCLTALTVWAASWPVGHNAHLFIAIAIASVKATAVYAIFMHLKYESKLMWFVSTYPLIIFALMILGTTGDASVKRESLPKNVEVMYKQGQGFGVNDEFLQENPDAPKFDSHH